MEIQGDYGLFTGLSLFNGIIESNCLTFISVRVIRQSGDYAETLL